MAGQVLDKEAKKRPVGRFNRILNRLLILDGHVYQGLV